MTLNTKNSYPGELRSLFALSLCKCSFLVKCKQCWLNSNGYDRKSQSQTGMVLYDPLFIKAHTMALAHTV